LKYFKRKKWYKRNKHNNGKNNHKKDMTIIDNKSNWYKKEGNILKIIKEKKNICNKF
jgi:hypothetical protein